MGNVRSNVLNNDIKKEFLVEMIARTVKKIFNLKLREVTIENKNKNDDNDTFCKYIAVKQLNLLVGEDNDSKNFWDQMKTTLVNYFGKVSLTEEENNMSGFELAASVYSFEFFNKIIIFMGIKLTKKAMKSFKNSFSKDSIEGIFFTSEIFFFFF